MLRSGLNHAITHDLLLALRALGGYLDLNSTFAFIERRAFLYYNIRHWSGEIEIWRGGLEQVYGNISTNINLIEVEGSSKELCQETRSNNIVVVQCGYEDHR